METEDDIVMYEKLLYEMFSKKNPTNGIFQSYQLIDGCRLRSRTVPIADQVFCIATENDAIVAGMSGNLKCSGRLQLEDIGFSVALTESIIHIQPLLQPPRF